MKFIILLLLYLVSYPILGQDLNKFFIDAQVKRSISIYDLQKETWHHSDDRLAKEGSLPASTFKIIHTLIGLEEEVVSGKHDTIRWNGEPKLFKTFKIPNWNKDNDLEMAFKNSTVWYFEEISRQIKKGRYRKHLKKNTYSNRKNRNGKGYDFWNFGELRVTPVEQIELLLRLYKNELYFEDQHQELTKELMIEKEAPDFVLRSKTGWCYDKMDIGWYVGYLEVKDNVIFFATRIEKDLDRELKGFSALRKSITRDIIHELYNLDLTN